MWSFAAHHQAFRDGSSSPVEFLTACLEQIDAQEPVIHAFEFLRTEGALALAEASAARWREGTQLSSIDGMPIGVKDTIDTGDMPTGHGSPVYAGHEPAWDGASVQALRQAGAIIVGKTVTTEFAGPFPSKTRNPWNPDHTPGGSSSGSAASVASDMLPAALGTQVIGSIIRPASYCGVYAIKPTFGAVNRGGSHDNLSQSAHGVLSASLADGWNTLREIATRVGGDPGFAPLSHTRKHIAPERPVRLGVLRTAGYDIAEPYAKASLDELISVLRHAGVEVVWSDNDQTLCEVEAKIHEAQANSLEIVGYESLWPLRSYVNADPSKLSPLLQDRVARASEQTTEDYARMLATRESTREVYRGARDAFDAIITLSATGVAPLGLESTGNTIFNTPASYLGIPAVNLPLFAHEGLPLGAQVLGYWGEDHRLLNLAAGIESLWIQSVYGTLRDTAH